ncbi:MAG TPA: phosphate ABC transporter permease PstA [Thermoanaerobaculia bacterium]|nr:phosphate ABC transporter permease PstA [Thermoanaerobaculia bacterium]
MNPSVSQASAESVVDRARPAALSTRRTREKATGATGFFGDHRRRSELVGQSLTWLCGGALAFNVLLVLGIMILLAWNGLGYFWQRDLVEIAMKDGTKVLGEVWEIEQVPAEPGQAADTAIDRVRVKTANRDIGGLDFAWIDESAIAGRRLPAQAVLLERQEWGNFHGFMTELREGGKVVARGPEPVWERFEILHERAMERRERVEELEKGAIGDVNYEIEQLRLDRRKLEIQELPAAELQRRAAEIDRRLEERQAEYQQLADRLFKMREEMLADTLVMQTVAGETQEMPVGNVVRAVRPNDMGWLDKAGLYFSRGWEFIAADPRESNTEGGIFPAIFGTVMMVFIMSFAVAPLGVLAALYLREYAKQGLVVRLVRIAVNNLAGVPSIVFGVFGLGFFVYLIGGSLDQLLYPEALPTPTFGTGGILWASLTLALLTVPVVIVAAEEGLAAVPRIVREGSLALGATKFETIRRVVIPAAAPGILTGMILAMARAAGEVAPLMIVGMVKLAPTLPIDARPPFVHLERKFMHLGFHIFDVGFQSPNIEATTPLVFATALLLIVVVTVMNLVAISLRNHLRRKYAGSAI